jgi:hypothetical protein
MNRGSLSARVSVVSSFLAAAAVLALPVSPQQISASEESEGLVLDRRS